ncbi:MAG: poly-gamma-glutamate biosynthesis protein PgsC [Planctomycetota bacterium]
MIDVVSVAIGIGLAVSLVFSEVFGLAAGGMVVPGYISLYLDRPLHLALTIGCAFATYLIVRLLSTFVIIYGRRRTVAMILSGYLMRSLFDLLPVDQLLARFMTPEQLADPESSVIRVIGFIIPGLIAIWMDRQGVVETLSALAAAAVVVRLVLILLYGPALGL